MCKRIYYSHARILLSIIKIFRIDRLTSHCLRRRRTAASQYETLCAPIAQLRFGRSGGRSDCKEKLLAVRSTPLLLWSRASEPPCGSRLRRTPARPERMCRNPQTLSGQKPAAFALIFAGANRGTNQNIRVQKDLSGHEGRRASMFSSRGVR